MDQLRVSAVNRHYNSIWLRSKITLKMLDSHFRWLVLSLVALSRGWISIGKASDSLRMKQTTELGRAACVTRKESCVRVLTSGIIQLSLSTSINRYSVEKR